MFIQNKHMHLLQSILSEYACSFFLFGSRLTGKARPFSDVDLLYFEDINPSAMLRLEETLEASDLPYTVDLVHYGTCDADFKELIGNQYACIQASPHLKSVEQNHKGHFAYLPKILGLDVHEIDGVLIINSGFGSSMFNIAYGTPQNKPIDEVIPLVKQAFRTQSFAWWLPPSERNPNLTNCFLDAQFIFETNEHAMVCRLSDAIAHEPKTDLLCQAVHSEQHLQDFIHVLEPYDQSVRAFYEQVGTTHLAGSEKLFIGYAANKPVSIGILFINGSIASIFSLLTCHEARGKGYGSDMVNHLLNAAKIQNCEFATLSASSEAGYRLYERAGFKKIGEFDCFEYHGSWYES